MRQTIPLRPLPAPLRPLPALAALLALGALAAPARAQKADAPKAGAAGGKAAAPQGLGPIVPNRPGFTNGSATVAPGDALAENGAALVRAPASQGGLETLDLPQTNLRIGATPNLEAVVVLPDFFDAHGGDRALGDAAVGVKYKFYQSRDGNTKASVAPSVTLPTHTAFSTGQYDPALLLGVQTASGSRWTVSGNLVLAAPTVTDAASGGRGRVFTTTLSGAVAYTLTPTLSAYADAYDQVPRTGPTVPVADGGLAYLVTPNVQLDAEFYVGLGGAAPLRTLSGGLSFRL